MMNEMKEETCRCPQCSFEGLMSEFKPKKYASSASETTNGGKKHGLEIYVTSSKDDIEDS